MQKTIRTAAALIAASLSFITISAHATIFSMDEFVVTRNGVEVFRDSFDDGVLPPSGPDDGIVSTGQSYVVTGNGFFSENAGGNGRLLIDTSLGVPFTNISTGEPGLFNRARRILSSNPNSSNALTPVTAFTVSGLFDLSHLPANRGDGVGIRLEDFGSNRFPNANGGNDRINLSLRRGSTTGNLGVFFSAVNFGGIGLETFDVELLDPILASLTGASQILLTLSNAAGSSVIDASFDILDGGGTSIFSQTLDNVGNNGGGTAAVFSDEGFTRAAFDASQIVPEPGVLAIFCAGLAGLGIARRRRR